MFEKYSKMNIVGNSSNHPRDPVAAPGYVLKQLAVGGAVGFTSGYFYRQRYVVASHVVSKGFFLSQLLDHLGLLRLPWNWHPASEAAPSSSGGVRRSSLAGSPLNSDWDWDFFSAQAVAFLRKNGYVMLGYFGGYYFGNGSTSFVFFF